jgi:hypothetical protein
VVAPRLGETVGNPHGRADEGGECTYVIPGHEHGDSNGPFRVPGCNDDGRLGRRTRLDEYEEVRAEPTWFLSGVGHERKALGFSEVVSIVEKIGDAAEVAAELDPRTNTQA